MLSASLAERAAKPYIALHPDQADALSIKEHEEIEMTHASFNCRLPVKFDSGLAKGVAGIPVGLPGVPWFTFKSKISLTKLK